MKYRIFDKTKISHIAKINPSKENDEDCRKYSREKYSEKMTKVEQYKICKRKICKLSYPVICTETCAYHGMRNFSCSENFAYVVNGWVLSIPVCALWNPGISWNSFTLTISLNTSSPWKLNLSYINLVRPNFSNNSVSSIVQRS